MSMSNSKIYLVIYCSILLLIASGCSSESSKKLKIGDIAPDFLVEDLDGKPFELNKFKGSPVVIRFFITDCKFCRADTGVFNDYYEENNKKGLQILYLTSTVDRDKVEKFAKDLDIPFPVAIDFNKKVASLFRVKLEPQAIILGPDHAIISAILGGVTKEELDELLGKYLQ